MRLREYVDKHRATPKRQTNEKPLRAAFSRTFHVLALEVEFMMAEFWLKVSGTCFVIGVATFVLSIILPGVSVDSIGAVTLYYMTGIGAVASLAIAIIVGIWNPPS